jgi:hypothetical protein
VIERGLAAYHINSSAIAAALLVITNLIPLAGVLWFGWDLILILGLYWAENGVVGVINVGKILLAEGEPPKNLRLTVNGRPAASMGRPALAGFFCLHYGLFWIGHGIFVFTFIPAMTGMSSGGSGGAAPLELPDIDVPLLFAGAVGLAISHGVSFWTNFLGRGEYRHISAVEVMKQPYGRLVILHITIVLGGIVSAYLGSPIGSLLVLVVLKTALDLYFHLRQHRAVPGAWA